MDFGISQFGKMFHSNRKTSSALTPIISITIVICVPLVISIYENINIVTFVLLFLLICLVLCFIGVYIFFAIKAPQRLHREEFLENMAALQGTYQLFKRSGDKIEAIHVAKSINTSNPVINED